MSDIHAGTNSAATPNSPQRFRVFSPSDVAKHQSAITSRAMVTAVSTACARAMGSQCTVSAGTIPGGGVTKLSTR